ncbi:hypothetical protein BGX38DRAFT_1200369 [Terfezia claveryi]|nr:hypothetical protein BGX38DRAFT_1200369 [Terfezia claveryi]
MFTHSSLHLLAFTLATLQGLISATPLPQVRGGAAHYVANTNSGRGPHEGHGIGYPGNYDVTAVYDADDDEDLRNFNKVVYGNEGDIHSQVLPAGPKYTAEEQAIIKGIPTKIASSAAVRGFDEDLSVLKPPVKPVELGSAPSPDQETNPNSPTTSTSEIPASEIATEFPEYAEPRTFSTERVDYNLRTNNPNPSEDAPGGEENSNVALFSDEKAFHWSGGNGESIPRNDPQFKEALSWITGKFKPASGNGKGKGRARKDSVFNILGNF